MLPVPDGIAHAQECNSLHAPDYAPVVDKSCSQWILQHMDRTQPTFGPSGWQIEDQGKRYILVANYTRNSGTLNLEYFQTVDRALLIDDADLRTGRARPLRADRVDEDLDRSSVGLYLEQSYAEAIGMGTR